MQCTVDALREFESLSLRYGRCLFPPLRYVTSREKKRKALCKIVENLSDEAFPLCVPYIINTINMGKSICEEYEDSESQTEGILGWLPLMREYRDILLDEVKENRAKFRLKV